MTNTSTDPATRTAYRLGAAQALMGVSRSTLDDDQAALDALTRVLDGEGSDEDWVRVYARMRAKADEMLPVNVARMRRRGASWQAVGDALGVSRQAAQQRYGH